MNRSSAIFKIVFWSVIAVIFSAILVGATVMDFDWNRFGLHIGGEASKLVKTTEIDASDIDSLNLEWTYGTMNVTSYDGNEIIIEEKASDEMDDDELLSIDEENGTLNIKQKNNWHFFSFFWIGSKTIVRNIKIPEKQYDEIKAKLTSGNLDIENIEANTFDFKMTSGSIKANNLISNDLILNTTSGSMNINGSFDNVDTYSTSGSVDVETSSVPTELVVNVTSGSTTVTIPDNDGFILGKEKTSGIFRCDFDLDSYNRYKNGGNEYSVKMTSGMVSLLKK